MAPPESSSDSLSPPRTAPGVGEDAQTARVRLPEPDTADVADKPRLAAGVELSGEMPETGFQQQQWLAQRDGRFIQLTEILYAVAEFANGERTAAEIADAASERLGRKLVEDNVRELIATKLIPLGLIVKKDGTVAQLEASSARSPLAVNMRMAMVSPRFIDPFTKFLKYLFLPPVIIVVLIATAVAQGWLFFIHGVANSVESVLRQPTLLLAVLGMVILSTAWHEFGHAAALTYGGGKVRGMGAGLYLIYPAFYTDVTDNYRLGRWARVRTDLGGFYFNLILSAATIGLYQVTGAEFLLILVVLINFEIIHQTLPFVRLDGYWALADATGIPDFFSQVGPFLRTVFPLSFWKGPKLPHLKGWVKGVFAAYILVTVPLLAFLLFAMLKSVPRVMATGYDSMKQQVAAFQDAQRVGSVSGSVLPIVQLALLALPTLGLVYALYLLGKRALVALWTWAQPSTARRGVATLATAAGAGLLVLLWLPQLPFTRGVPGPLYAGITTAQPLTGADRGRIVDVVSSAPAPPRVTTSNPPGAGGPNVGGAAVPVQTPTPTLAPTVVQAAGPTATGTVAPTAASTVPVTPAQTPTASATVAPTQDPMVTPPANAPTAPVSGAAPTAGGSGPAPATVTPSPMPCGAPGIPAPTGTALANMPAVPTCTPTPASGSGLGGTPMILPTPTASPTPTVVPTP